MSFACHSDVVKLVHIEVGFHMTVNRALKLCQRSDDMESWPQMPSTFCQIGDIRSTLFGPGYIDNKPLR